MDETSLSILIIEDNAMFRSMAMDVFDGHEKFYAATVESGFEKFKEHCPDITLLDIGLPDGSGLDLLDDLIGYDPEAFIVMLTSSCVASDVKRAKEHGAAGYIIKPCTPNKLTDCIDRYAEFKERLSQLSSEERAGNYMEKLRVEAVDKDVSEHPVQDANAEHKAEKKKAVKHTIHDELPAETLEVLQGWRIMFVDDYLINRDRAKKQLSNLGCEVDTAENGQELLKLIKEHSYNLIFLDTKLPDMDGYKAAKQIRRIERENNKEQVLIIALVEDNYEIEDQMWQHAGMNGYIKKPAQFAQLREMLRKQIDLQSEEYIN